MNPNFPNSEQPQSDSALSDTSFSETDLLETDLLETDLLETDLLETDLLETDMNEVTQSNGAESLKRDRFELISAYLDGEVTADERRQVELWLQTDPQAKQLYARLMMLRKGFQNLSTPAASQPVERTVQQVVSKIERKSRRKVFAWSGMAIAAMFVSALVGGLPRPEYASNHLLTGQTAQAPQPAIGVPEDALMISLNRSLLPLPEETDSKTAKPSPSSDL
jgi:anti-sigma factor RsiW